MEELVLAHEPDIAWLIAPWIAIHGWDPAPEVPRRGARSNGRPAAR